MLAGELVDLGHFLCVRLSAESLVVIRIDVVLAQTHAERWALETLTHEEYTNAVRRSAVQLRSSKLKALRYQCSVQRTPRLDLFL